MSYSGHDVHMEQRNLLIQISEYMILIILSECLQWCRCVFVSSKSSKSHVITNQCHLFTHWVTWAAEDTLSLVSDCVDSAGFSLSILSAVMEDQYDNKNVFGAFLFDSSRGRLGIKWGHQDTLYPSFYLPKVVVSVSWNADTCLSWRLTTAYGFYMDKTQAEYSKNLTTTRVLLCITHWVILETMSWLCSVFPFS